MASSKDSLDFLSKLAQYLASTPETPEIAVRNYLNQTCTKCQGQASRINELEKKCEILQMQLVQMKKRYNIYQKVNDLGDNNNQAEIVKLNVGGVVFHVKKENLIGNGSESFFSCLISHENMIEKDGDGNIFIDRDPDLFAFILDLLRSGNDRINHEILQQIGFERLISLKNELEFYQLTDLSNRANVYHLQLSAIAQLCKEKTGLAAEVNYEWKNLEIIEDNAKITYMFNPIDRYNSIILPILPVTMILSENDDPRRFNYVEVHLDKGGNVAVGLMQKDERNPLGSTANSFGINYNCCINNNKSRENGNWGIIDANFCLGLWFDVTTRNLIIYYNKFNRNGEKTLEESKKIIAFKGCMINATKDWVLAIQLDSGQTASVLKDARHPERPVIEDEQEEEISVDTTAASTSNEKASSTNEKQSYTNRRRRKKIKYLK